MKRFVEGADRGQSTLLPECLDEWVEESNSVRVVDCFVDGLDLTDLGFEGVEPAATGRSAYHPSALLKLYIYGYLNRVLCSIISKNDRTSAKRNNPHLGDAREIREAGGQAPSGARVARSGGCPPVV